MSTEWKYRAINASTSIASIGSCHNPVISGNNDIALVKKRVQFSVFSAVLTGVKNASPNAKTIRNCIYHSRDSCAFTGALS